MKRLKAQRQRALALAAALDLRCLGAIAVRRVAARGIGVGLDGRALAAVALVRLPKIRRWRMLIIRLLVVVLARATPLLGFVGRVLLRHVILRPLGVWSLTCH